MAKTRNRSFYSSILFGALSVCVVFLYFIIPGITNQKFRLIEVHWYKEGVYPLWRIPKRQFLDVIFTGDNETDLIKIQFGRLYIREMLDNKDTTHAIDFHFSDKSSFANFITVLDVCDGESCPFFAPSDSGIKVYFLQDISNPTAPLRIL
jgi:hypothetical protein